MFLIFSRLDNLIIVRAFLFLVSEKVFTFVSRLKKNISRDKIMTHGSLFSGIGGFDLAAEWAGWENVFNKVCICQPYVIYLRHGK